MSGNEDKATANAHFFGVEEEAVDGAHVIAVRGELDLHTAPQLEQQVEPAIASGAGTLVLDLSGCEFIDSTGIGLIVRAWQQLDSDADGNGVARFALCGLSDQVRRLLKITGLESSIRTFRSRDEALAELRGDG